MWLLLAILASSPSSSLPASSLPASVTGYLDRAAPPCSHFSHFSHGVFLSSFLHQNLDLKKNASGDPVGAQSDSKVAPKRPQNGDWGVHFGDFSCNRAILHPICYLLCFYHILQVSSGPFCDNFPEKMSAGHRPPAKSFSVSFFCDFYAKRCQNGVPNGGGIAP